MLFFSFKAATSLGLHTGFHIETKGAKTKEATGRTGAGMREFNLKETLLMLQRQHTTRDLGLHFRF